MISKFTKIPLAALYRAGYLLHHKIFLKKGVSLKHARMVIVGSYRMGGAGKTPFCIWLAKELCRKGMKVAVLCHSAAKDESILLEKALPACTVIATWNRYRVAHEIDDSFDVIICDDGFEDSRLGFAGAICLEWEHEPETLHDIFPAGLARSFPKDHPNTRLRLRCAGEEPDVQFSLQAIENSYGKSLLETDGEAVLVAGIGDPGRFFRDVESTGRAIRGKRRLRDHSTKLKKVVTELLAQGLLVVTTEKDACRLDRKAIEHENLFIARQAIHVSKAAEQETLDLLLPTHSA